MDYSQALPLLKHCPHVPRCPNGRSGFMIPRQATLYGAGGNALPFLAVLQEAGVQIDCLADRFSERSELQGYPIVRPESLIDLDRPVFVCVGGTSGPIADELRAAGHRTVYDFNDCARMLPGLVERFLPLVDWHDPDHTDATDHAAFDALAARLEDDISRDLLRTLRAFRTSPDGEHYLPNDYQRQYFPADVPLLDRIDSLRFVDCGAYTGDTLDSLMTYSASAGLPVDSVCLFEPDATHLPALTQRVADLPEPGPRAVVVPAGAWSENGQLRLVSNGTSSAIVDARAPDTATALQTIQTVKLDDVVFGLRPNYVKMDIEGAEHEALKGAAHLLRRYRPVLAICLYHRPSDLWTLPSLVDELAPGYAFYLRSHGDVGLETVLYAVPQR